MNINVSRIAISKFNNLYQPSKNKYPNFKSQEQKPDTFEMSVGYVNDIHGQTNNMIRILSGLKGDLKVSAGDNSIGDDKNASIHKATVTFLNQANIVATALGNHEMDVTQGYYMNIMDTMNTTVLSSNMQKKKNWKLRDDNLPEYGRHDDYIDKLKPSIIVEVKGEKIGLIGTSPMDIANKSTHPYYYDDCQPTNIDDVIQYVQTEVNKLKEQGINKIILLSHIGFTNDQELAKQIDGIDVIVSGHTHELIKGVTEGKNLLSSKSGEPIVITEAGRNGNYFGLLNLTFDKDGVLTKVQNNIAATGDFSKNMVNQYIFDEILGKSEEIGIIQETLPHPKNTMDENPHANFVCDAMRYETKADIALWHHTGVRSYFHKGILDSSEVKDMAPFLDRVVTANVSEEKLVDIFKKTVNDACKAKNGKPGLIAVSGLDYTIDKKNGKLVAMNFVDKNGNKISIDIEHPRENKFYVIAMDEFLMEAGADYPKFGELDECLTIYPYDKDVMTCNYIKYLNKPIVINQSGRIHFTNKGE